MYNGANTNDLNEVIEFIYNDLACKDGKQTRRMIGVGVSLGASILGIYAARAGNKNRLDACFGCGCHFNTPKFVSFISTSYFGFYDYFLGYWVRSRLIKAAE